MMLLIMQPRSQVLSYPSRWWCVLLVAKCLFCLFVYMFRAPRCRKADRRAKSTKSCFQLFSLVDAITRPGYQASEASNAIRVLHNCKASQENIVVPLQNCISVYNDSETPSKWTGSYPQKVRLLLESIFTPTLNSFSWFGGMEGEDAGFKTCK